MNLRSQRKESVDRWLSHQFNRIILISSKLFSRPDRPLLKISDLLNPKLAAIGCLQSSDRAIFIINN